MCGPNEDRRWIPWWIALSPEGMRTEAGGPSACVIVRDGALVAERRNEIVAIGVADAFIGREIESPPPDRWVPFRHQPHTETSGPTVERAARANGTPY